MEIWGKLFAAGYDHFLAPAEKAGLASHRERLLVTAQGRVLEIGGGTGANLPFYGDGVAELVIAEPAEPMVRQLARKLPGYRIPTRVLRAPAEQLPFEAGSFDCVVSTLVLCTVADPNEALAEVRRVLKSEGRFLFIEHVRSTDPELARFQDRMNGINRFVVGCDCNRPTLDSLQEAGFTIAQVEHTTLPKAPKFARPAIVGSATAPASAPARDAQLATGNRP